MFEAAYRKRLTDDLPRWQAQGWVSAEGAAAIMGSVREARSGFGLSAVLAVLGTLLFGLGVIAFIAANWAEMPRLMRFGLLVLGLAVSFTLAALLARRGHPAFAEAALLLSGLMYAAAIALVGQTYHLAGEFSGAVLLWSIGVLGAAVLTRSPLLTALAVLGSGYWGWLETFEAGTRVHWPSLLLLLVCLAHAALLHSKPARVLALLAINVWVVAALVALSDRLDWPVGAGFALGAAAALTACGLGRAIGGPPLGHARLSAFGAELFWLELATLLITLAMMQSLVFGREMMLGEAAAWAGVGFGLAALAAVGALARGGFRMLDLCAVVALGAGTLALMLWEPADGFAARLASGVLVLTAALWTVSVGEAVGSRGGKWLGLTAFALEVLYLYAATLGTLLDTAFAFLAGGLLFIVLAVLLFRLDRISQERSA